MFRSVVVHTGVKRGERIKLKKILSGCREMLVRQIGVNAGHDFIIQKARNRKRYIQVIVNAHGVTRIKLRKRNELWGVTQHTIVRFSKNVNRYAVARHIAEHAHAHRAQIGGRSVNQDFVVRALTSYMVQRR